MSIDYGDLAVAFRGKAEDLRALGPAAEKWLKKQDTADWDQALVEEIRRFAGMFALEGRDGGEAVLVETGTYFTHYVGCNLWCVNAMSKACPAVEVAAVTKVSSSVTDKPQWLAYFSPAGKKGIAGGNSPDDIIWKGKALMWPQGGDGKQYPFQFCRVEDYEGAVHELDVSMVRGNYNSGCTALVLRSPKNVWKFANVRLYFCDWYGDEPYPPIQADEKSCRELEERFQGVYACADFFGCAKEPGGGKWSWEDSEPMKELPDGADEFILGIFKLLLPKADITIKKRDGRRFYFDGKGNEYFFLGNVDRSTIQTAKGYVWAFPPDAVWAIQWAGDIGF